MSESDPTVINVIHPDERRPAFDFRVTFGADPSNHYAYLTYRITGPGPSRDLLLMMESEFPKNLLSQSEVTALKGLASQLGLHEHAGRSRTGMAKAVVNEIAAGWKPSEGTVAVAVHRFGPVPVCVLAQEHPVLSQTGTRQVRIALYPGNETPGYGPGLPAVFNKVEFLHSLNVALPLTFARYMEDVGETFADIENHCGLREVFRYARRVEQVLAESVKTKLDEILRNAKNHKPSAATTREVALEVFRANRPAVALALYARVFALFLLNELYEVIGLKERIAKYREQLNDFDADFQKHLRGAGLDTSFDPFQVLPELMYLREAAHQYEQFRQHPDQIAEASDDAPQWVRQFVDFSRFVALVRVNAVHPVSTNDRKGEFCPQVPQIFMSTVEKVPAADMAYNQIVNHVTSKHAGRVRLLNFKDEPIRTLANSTLRSRVWISSAVCTVVPRKPHSWEGRPKNFSWIAREVEHGLLLRNRVYHVLEANAQPELLKAFADKSVGYLVPQTRLSLERRAARVKGSLEDRVWATFAVVDGREGAPRDIQDAVDRMVGKEVELHTDGLVRGYLSWLPKEVRKALPVIRRKAITGPSARKDWIGTILEKNGLGGDRGGQVTFERWYGALNNRVLRLGQTGYTLIIYKPKTRQYHWRLQEILRAMRPSASQEEVKDWEGDLLNWLQRA